MNTTECPNDLCHYHTEHSNECYECGALIHKESGWISVKDRLPKEYELVLAADRSNRYWIDRIIPNKLRFDWYDWYGFGEKPDYWMPIPALPGSEEE